MYDDILHILSLSNISSFIKEDIIRNKLIKKNKDAVYYEKIRGIILSKDIGLIKEKKLIKFLIKEQ